MCLNLSVLAELTDGAAVMPKLQSTKMKYIWQASLNAEKEDSDDRIVAMLEE